MMEGHARGLGWIAAASLAAVAGCGLLTDTYPQPEGRPLLELYPSAPGGGQTASDLCACVAAIGIDPSSLDSCATCLNDSIAPGAACQDEGEACLQSPGCEIVRDCLSMCKYDPSCIGSCLLPWEADPGRGLYRDFLTCGCAKCADKCKYPEPLTCDTLPAGTGGAGGTGGASSSSGAGGTGGAGGTAGP